MPKTKNMREIILNLEADDNDEYTVIEEPCHQTFLTASIAMKSHDVHVQTSSQIESQRNVEQKVLTTADNMIGNCKFFKYLITIRNR